MAEAGGSMSQEIISVLNYLGEQLGVAIDWTSENVWPQVVDILGRYRLMEIINMGLWMVFEFSVVLIAVIVFVKGVKAYKTVNKTKGSNFWWEQCYYGSIELSFEGGFLMVIMGFTGVAFLVAFSVNIGEILKWIIVPEIKYLEMLKGLMA